MVNVVHNIDCMIGMSEYPDKYFDIAVVDPPYGINRNNMNMGNSIFNKDCKTWDKNIPDINYFNLLFKICNNLIIWGGNYFPLPQSQYFIIWDKGETMYERDFAECEYAWVKNGGTRICKISPNQKDRIHPTQKPVKLYDWIFTKYAQSGMKILDTHVGSGSSRIAAHKHKLDFIGYELDEEYWNAQEKRFAQYKSQLTLW